jgi:hypothetical protein
MSPVEGISIFVVPFQERGQLVAGAALVVVKRVRFRIYPCLMNGLEILLTFPLELIAACS